MLQICDNLCRFAKVLYVSGEESERQIKLRAQRLNVAGEGSISCRKQTWNTCWTQSTASSPMCSSWTPFRPSITGISARGREASPR